MEKPEPYLTVPEVAAILRCSEHDVRRLCRIGPPSGGLRAVKAGKRWLIPPKALKEWENRNIYQP
ncbi:helix-turn-helix domain-containing protein [Kocuria sp. U4B]